MILQALRNSCQLQPQWPSIFVEIGGWRPLSLSAQHSTIEILKFSFVPSICLFLPCRRVIIFDEQLNSNEFLHTFIPVHDLSTHVPKRLLPSRSSRCRLSLEVNSTIGDVNQKKKSICHRCSLSLLAPFRTEKCWGFLVGRTTGCEKVIEVMIFQVN